MSGKLTFVLALTCLLAVGTGVATADLIGYWSMDEGQGTVVKDVSGNGNDGTIVGSPTYVPGMFGMGMKFNGTTDAVDLGQKAVWNPTGSLSIAFWANIGAWNTNWGHCMVSNRGDDNIGWQVRMSGFYAFNGNVSGMAFTTRGVGNDDFTTDAIPPMNTWLHVACVYDNAANTKTIYWNGVVQKTGTTNAGATIAATTVDTYIGTQANASNVADSTKFFTGILDEVRIYSNALSANDVMGLVQVPTATSPAPSNLATDVRIDTALGWQKGAGAVTHNVYLGTDANAVKNATAGSPLLVSAGQGATTYQPPKVLALNTTYCWRVDEVNGASVYTGDLWSFTTEPLYYTVTGVTATASSFATGSGPENTVNGSGLDASDQHGSTAGTMWLTTALPAWIQYDLGRATKVMSMMVWNYNGLYESLMGVGAKNVTVQYSADGTNWTQLAGVPVFLQGTGLAGYASNTTVSFGGVPARYVKLTITSNWGGLTPSTGLSEVRFIQMIDYARTPVPASGATGVSPTVTLSWRPGRQAVSHKVYVGTDPNALTLSGTSNTTSFAPANLSVGTLYYWRVDEVNSAEAIGTWAGDVWSFTTPKFITIDDMESYTNTTGNRIYQFWVDGYGTTTNGSTVGYTTGTSYVEKSIVHGGQQSMPFAYNNATLSVSEGTRTWTSPVNWTTNGADTLRLWVQGRTANVPTATSLPAATASFDISAGGADVYQGADGMRFVYKQLTGDGSITAHVDFQQPTSQWAKSGVMIRVGTTSGAIQAYMATMPGTPNTTGTPLQVEWGYRATDSNTAANSLGITPASPSYWVRVTRTGNSFLGEYSADGVTWVSTSLTTTPQTIAMTDPVNIGLLVCGHVTTQLGEAKFSSVQTSGNISAGDWQVADVGWAMTDVTTPTNTPDAFYVTLADSSSHSKTIVPAITNAVCTTGVWQAVDIPLSSFAGVTTSSVKSMTIGVGSSTSPQHGAGLIFIDDIGYGKP